MSIKVMTNVWDHSKAKGSSLLLLLAIADHAGDDGFAWPSEQTLAKKIRMSTRHVRRMITALASADEPGDKPELFVNHRCLEKHGNGGPRSNQYVILVGQDRASFEETLKTKLKLSADEIDEASAKYYKRRTTCPPPNPDNLSGGADSAMSGGADSAMSGGADSAMSAEPSVTVNEITTETTTRQATKPTAPAPVQAALVVVVEDQSQNQEKPEQARPEQTPATPAPIAPDRQVAAGPQATPGGAGGSPGQTAAGQATGAGVGGEVEKIALLRRLGIQGGAVRNELLQLSHCTSRYLKSLVEYREKNPETRPGLYVQMIRNNDGPDGPVQSVYTPPGFEGDKLANYRRMMAAGANEHEAAAKRAQLDAEYRAKHGDEPPTVVVGELVNKFRVSEARP